jgi:hypothetical protein
MTERRERGAGSIFQPVYTYKGEKKLSDTLYVKYPCARRAVKSHAPATTSRARA